MITTMIRVEWCLTRYPTKISVTDAIRVRLVPFDPRLSAFVFENICICIRIWSYPYSNLNSNKNMKTNMISLIFVRIRSDYTPNLRASFWWARRSSYFFLYHRIMQTNHGRKNHYKNSNFFYDIQPPHKKQHPFDFSVKKVIAVRQGSGPWA
jgi:hypothetical protein